MICPKLFRMIVRTLISGDITVLCGLLLYWDVITWWLWVQSSNLKGSPRLRPCQNHTSHCQRWTFTESTISFDPWSHELNHFDRQSNRHRVTWGCEQRSWDLFGRSQRNIDNWWMYRDNSTNKQITRRQAEATLSHTDDELIQDVINCSPSNDLGVLHWLKKHSYVKTCQKMSLVEVVSDAF